MNETLLQMYPHSKQLEAESLHKNRPVRSMFASAPPSAMAMSNSNEGISEAIQKRLRLHDDDDDSSAASAGSHEKRAAEFRLMDEHNGLGAFIEHDEHMDADADDVSALDKSRLPSTLSAPENKNLWAMEARARDGRTQMRDMNANYQRVMIDKMLRNTPAMARDE